MPDNMNPTEQEEHQKEPGQPHGDPQTDWKAEARKWEARAKQNSQAAAELEQLKNENMSESEKTAKRIKQLETENAAYKTAAQRREWVAQVSKETGVPANLLRGDSLEAIQEHAAALNEALHPKPKAPQVHGVDRQPSTGSNNDQKLAYLRALGL